MCVLIVPDELKAMSDLSRKQYSKEFESYWSVQRKDEATLVLSEKDQHKP